jgi:hypothetical protein
VNKLIIRKGIAEHRGISFEKLYSEWGDRVGVRWALFQHSNSIEKEEEGSKQTHLFPKYPLEIQGWKDLLHDYCLWHDITSLDQIVNLWSDIVDAFKACPGFDEQVGADFRAWVYGCCCLFMLEKRKQQNLEMRVTQSTELVSTYMDYTPYSPEHPAY